MSINPTKTPSNSEFSWCLRFLDQPLAGTTWALSDAPLHIGRGLGCRLRLDDARVSRLQCELWLEDGAPRLRNHGRTNPTTVNGISVEETLLNAGDLIEFATYYLVVEAGPAGTHSQVLKDITPTARSFADTPFHPNAPVSPEQARTLANELLSLFGFSRSLAEAASLDGLVERLRQHVTDRLSAQKAWLAWPVRGTNDTTFYPPGAEEEEHEAALPLVRESAISETGILKRRGRECLIVAPMLQAGKVIGAVCAISKPKRPFTEQDLDYLVAVAETTVPHLLAVGRLEQYERDAQCGDSAGGAHPLLGNSPPMAALRENIRRAALSRGHVLLLGESGTGKELAARMIHDMSARAGGPYVPVNCAALPADLFESEMFGHEKGAFTGAAQRRKGLFEEAHGGTLFLDEMGDLSITSQARLLRAADSGIIRRVGGAGTLHVDVRIVSASNRDLPELAGKDFRLDLYHRLAGFVIQLPPLRARREDIPALATYFLRLASSHSQARPSEFAPEALDALTAHDWPGNVRELRNVVERACYLATDNTVRVIEPLRAQGAVHHHSDGAVPSLHEVEARHLENLLNAHGGDVAAAAVALGIPQSTMYYKLSKYGIRRKSARKRKGGPDTT